MSMIIDMWNKFDSDKSGQISSDEFMREMTRGVPDQGVESYNKLERAKRNLNEFRSMMKSKGVTFQQLL